MKGFLTVSALAFSGHSQVRLAVLPSAAASVLVEFWFSQVWLAVLPSAAASCLVETALLFRSETSSSWISGLVITSLRGFLLPGRTVAATWWSTPLISLRSRGQPLWPPLTLPLPPLRSRLLELLPQLRRLPRLWLLLLLLLRILRLLEQTALISLVTPLRSTILALGATISPQRSDSTLKFMQGMTYEVEKKRRKKNMLMLQLGVINGMMVLPGKLMTTKSLLLAACLMSLLRRLLQEFTARIPSSIRSLRSGLPS